MRKLLPFLLLASLLGCGGGEDNCVSPVSDNVIKRVDLEIASNTRIQPGTYRFADPAGKGVLRVVADNVTVDLGGVTIVGADDKALPDSYEGIAIRLEGRKGVTIRGGVFRGFRGGIYMKDCSGCVIEGCDVSDNRAQRLKSTPSKCDDGADWLAPHFNDGNEWWKEYGAGIYLDGCVKCEVTDCRGRRTQNGIVLRNSDSSRIYGNDMSWMSGWGLAMWRSSKNDVRGNRFDFGVRGYSFGVYDRGQDSAGILMFEQCSDNTIAYNSATHGGDGIFIYAGHETTQRTGEGGCSRNLVYKNDFSHAVANAIECTFSDGNRFIENTLDDSNYGVWAGYSYNTLVSGNTCANARVSGVAIEHGHKNVIEGNVFEKCATGVELWWNENAEFMKGAYGQKQNCKSEEYSLTLNQFRECPLALRVGATREAEIVSNEFKGCGRLADFSGKCDGLQFAFNRIEGESPGWFRNDTGEKIEIGPCLWKDRKPADTDDVTYALGPEELNLDFSGIARRVIEMAQPGKIPGTATTAGMNSIVIDEWGPCDPAVPKIFPARQTLWGGGKFFVFGPAGTWKLTKRTGECSIDVSGTVPGTVTVGYSTEQVLSGCTGTPFSFEIVTSTGAKLTASGTLLEAQNWEIQFRPWQPGPGEHGDYATKLDEKGWAKLMQQRPAVRATLPRLSTPWAGQPIPLDHFATTASTTMSFPAGNWRFTTTSDDGVRVFVDGKKIIDHWTWHAPEEDTADVLLNSGAHEIVVEHFEIDGAEALDLAIEPAP